jgi:uncharacterized membrane protein
MKTLAILTSIIGFIFVIIGIVFGIQASGATGYEFIFVHYLIAIFWSVFGLFFLLFSYITFLFDKYIINKIDTK